jgi:hypothetical protein
MTLGLHRGFLASAVRIALVLAAVPALANAYIDPGSGSFLLQAALAGLLGFSFTLKSFWRNLTGRFKQSHKDASDG